MDSFLLKEKGVRRCIIIIIIIVVVMITAILSYQLPAAGRSTISHSKRKSHCQVGVGITLYNQLHKLFTLALRTSQLQQLHCI